MKFNKQVKLILPVSIVFLALIFNSKTLAQNANVASATQMASGLCQLSNGNQIPCVDIETAEKQIIEIQNRPPQFFINQDNNKSPIANPVTNLFQGVVQYISIITWVLITIFIFIKKDKAIKKFHSILSLIVIVGGIVYLYIDIPLKLSLVSFIITAGPLLSLLLFGVSVVSSAIFLRKAFQK